jgi:uncharacterized protein (TIGR03083 family)
MRRPEPVLATELFPPLDRELIGLLRSLSDAEWNRAIGSGRWSVKDVSAHLLDTAVRRLSLHRDGYSAPDTPKLQTDDDLKNFINQMNAYWVKAARRLSPRLLIELLERTGRELYEFFTTLDSCEAARFPVSWAGEESSLNWFDIAREYTERWHHQEQIRETVSRPELTSRKYLYPVLDTFMRALPHVYRSVQAPTGTVVRIAVSGDAGGEWYVRRKNDGWELLLDVKDRVAAAVEIPQDVAWKLFTKGLDKASAETKMKFEGDAELGRVVLEMVCIVG